MPGAPDPTFYDRIAIRDLVELYADRLNHADWEGYARTLHEDIEFEVSEPDRMYMRGREELVNAVKGAYTGGFVHQMTHNIIVDRVTGDRARARHTLHIFGTKFRMIALYYDGVVRTAEGWKFRHRDVQITWKEDGPPSGRQYRQLPDPGRPEWYEAFV